MHNVKTKKEKVLKLSPFCTQTRGRTGMEVNPLVFETSASTDSAIWAFRSFEVCFSIADAKVRLFSLPPNFFSFFLQKKVFVTSFIINKDGITKINLNLAETLILIL